MAILFDTVAKKEVDADIFVFSSISLIAKDKTEEDKLRAEYLYANDYTAWIEQFISKHEIKSINGNDFNKVTSEKFISSIISK